MSDHKGSLDTQNYTPQQVAEILTEKAHLRHRVESMETEVARLREAIKSEAKIHARHRHPGDFCSCGICKIAREGR